MWFNIHAYVECRVSDRWELARPPIDDASLLWTGWALEHNGVSIGCVFDRDGLIAVLSGCSIPALTEPVAPIGTVGELPADMSRELQAIRRERTYDRPDLVGSVTVRELLDADWEQTVIMQGRVPPDTAHRFSPSEPFPSDLEDVQGLLQSPWHVDRGVLVRWSESYLDLVGEEFLAWVQSLEPLGSPSRVRLVHWAV